MQTKTFWSVADIDVWHEIIFYLSLAGCIQLNLSIKTTSVRRKMVLKVSVGGPLIEVVFNAGLMEQSSAELGVFHVISAFCLTGVSQNTEITRKSPSSTSGQY